MFNVNKWNRGMKKIDITYFKKGLYFPKVKADGK